MAVRCGPLRLLIAALLAFLAGCAELPTTSTTGPTQLGTETLQKELAALRTQVARLEAEKGDKEQTAGQIQALQQELVQLRDDLKKLREEGQLKPPALVAGARRDIGISPAPTPGTPFYENSWAVIVGIDKYAKAPQLQYAVNDARSVAQALPALGFPPENIFLLVNERATKRNIQNLLGDTLPQKAKVNDRVFIFFAGHGVTRDLPGGQGTLGYLVPFDGDMGQLHATGISMRDLADISRLIPAKHLFIAADACYSGLILERSGPAVKPDVKGYLEVVTKRPVRQILTAGLKDQAVVEERGHGIFTRKFLEGLRGAADVNGDGAITGFEIGGWIVPQVASATENRQTPHFGTMSGDGEFVFLTPEAVDPLYVERRRLQEMEARLAKLQAEAFEAKRLSLHAIEATRAEAGERARALAEKERLLAEEKRALEQLREQIRRDKDVAEAREKATAEKRQLGARAGPPAIPIQNPVALSRVAPGVRHRVQTSAFVVDFSISGGNLTGIVVSRNPDAPILIRWCYDESCRSDNWDKTVAIALPGQPPFEGQTFTSQRPSSRGKFDGVEFSSRP